mgnify:FL=1|jgi:hypothetical protein
MAAVSSTFKDPSLNFVWWIEGDKIAIASSGGDGGTTETAKGRYKAAMIGTGTDHITSGVLISYYAEPDKLESITGTIDIDNTLQPAIIAYVKAKALLDAAARTNNAELAQIKMQSAQMAMNEYKQMVTKYGVRRRDKTGGTRGIVPTNFT